MKKLFENWRKFIKENQDPIEGLKSAIKAARATALLDSDPGFTTWSGHFYTYLSSYEKLKRKRPEQATEFLDNMIIDAKRNYGKPHEHWIDMYIPDALPYWRKLTDKQLNEISQSEVSWFGGAFEQLYKEPELAFDEDWIEENIGRQIGSGYSRTAYNIDSHPELVFKVVNRWELADGSYTNAEEKFWFNRYPEFFPRVWLTGDFISPEEMNKQDPSTKLNKGWEFQEYIPWIIVDKVKVFGDEYQGKDPYKQFLLKKFPSLGKVISIIKPLLPTEGDWRPYMPSIDELFGAVIGSYGESIEKLVKQIPMPVTQGPPDPWDQEANEHPFSPEAKQWRYEFENQIIDMVNKDPNFAKVKRLIKDVGMDADDIRPGNIGTDVATRSKLIFLDINKFIFEAGEDKESK